MKTILLFLFFSISITRSQAMGIIAPHEYYVQKNQTSATESLNTITETTPPASCEDCIDIKLENFVGNLVNNKLRLEWTIAENHDADRFELLKSADGKNFKMAALVFSSEKKGREVYGFVEKVKKETKMYYRLRMIGRDNKIELSNVITIESQK